MAILVVAGGTGLAVVGQASARTLPRDGVQPTGSSCFKDRKMVRQTTIWSTARVYRNKDLKRYRCESAWGTEACNTPMVNDKNVTSYAEGSILYKGISYSARTSSY